MLEALEHNRHYTDTLALPGLITTYVFVNMQPINFEFADFIDNKIYHNKDRPKLQRFFVQILKTIPI